MNILSRLQTLNVDSSVLVPKKQQTTKKIEYVRDYAELWATISAERKGEKNQIETINFVDCMCNAGVYSDGDCGTAIEVMLIFQELAGKYPDKLFRVFCNDIDGKKIAVLKTLVKDLRRPFIKNLRVYCSQKDVNSYLDELLHNITVDGKSLFGYGSSTLLFVDPYDFGTVEIPKLSEILKCHYCELIFNFFISDFVRNIQQDKGRIRHCLGGIDISTKEELIKHIRLELKTGYIKHLFSYQFRTTNNVELYQIVFATPNVRGLEKLKEVLWKTFDGTQFHRNKAEESDQFSLFTNEDDKNSRIQSYSSEAIDMIIQYYINRTITYNDIEIFLIENTMLNAAQIVNNVIKPMIAAGQIEKCGLVRKNNYKCDSYRIIGKRSWA